MIITVLTAVIASHLLGWFWYSKVGFGKMWMKLSGITVESMKAAKSHGHTPAKSMGISMALAFLSASLLYIMIRRYGILFECVMWIWVAIALPIYSHKALWENKSWMLVFLNAAHGFVSTAVMAAVIYWLM